MSEYDEDDGALFGYETAAPGPDVMLGYIRMMAGRWAADGHLDDEDTGILVAMVDALDEWLCAGGEYPVQWKYAHQGFPEVRPARRIEDLPPL